MKRLKYFLFGFIAIGAGCVAALLISEMLVRIISPQMTGPRQFSYDPQLGAIPVPNQKARRTLPGVYDYEYQNNSLGFRGGREYAIQKQTSFRLLFLGDSFTYGIGVNDKDTFVNLIEEQLAKDYSIEAINAGSGGKGTDYAVKLFEIVGYQLRPDITCLCFFPNDFIDNQRCEYYSVIDGQIIPLGLSHTVNAKKEKLSNIPMYDWIISWSHVANLLKQAVINRAVKKEPNQSNNDVIHYSKKNQTYSNEQNRKLTQLYVDTLAIKLKKLHSDFLIFYIPSVEDVEHYRQTQSFLTDELAFRKIVMSHTSRFLSLTPVLANSKYSIDALYYSEGHWTPLAHKLSGNAMRVLVENQIKLGKRTKLQGAQILLQR